MNIVFFGSPACAVPSLEKLLAAGHGIELVITQPDKPAGRGRGLTSCPIKRFAEARGIPTATPVKIRKEESVLEKIQAMQPDVNVVVAYGQIIPDPILYVPPYNTLNVHFSLLPKYRGAAPVQWAVLHGESETGITIIELNDKMDEGDVLSQVRTEIQPRETAGVLESRLAELGADLLLDTLARIDRIPHVPQDHSQATLAPKIKKEDGQIDWAEDARIVDRKVRAFSPRPGAFTHFRDKFLHVHKGTPFDGRHGDRPAGEILRAGKKGLEVACGEGSVFLIEELQPEGKKRMDAHAFSLGAKILPEERFGGD